MIALLSLASALAAPPDPDLLPWAAPWEVSTHYAAHRKASGESPRALACAPLWPDTARICLQRERDGRLHRLHTDELDGPVEDAVARLGKGAEAWVRSEVERVGVEGMKADYRMLRDARGRAVLGVLAPQVLAADVGLPLVVGLPQTGVLVAWKGGDPDLDKVMAVGVRELHDAARDPVSPVLFAWDGERWFPFAEATPVVEEEGEKEEGGPSEEDPPSGADGTRTHDL